MILSYVLITPKLMSSNESSNDISVGSSICENQIQSDSDLEDDLFSLAEDKEIF